MHGAPPSEPLVSLNSSTCHRYRSHGCMACAAGVRVVLRAVDAADEPPVAPQALSCFGCMLTVRAGYRRSGDVHANTQFDVVLSGAARLRLIVSVHVCLCPSGHCAAIYALPIFVPPSMSVLSMYVSHSRELTIVLHT